MPTKKREDHRIKDFFDADPWRTRIFFLGALWWLPFLVGRMFLDTYYFPVGPPASIWLDVAKGLYWFMYWPVYFVSVPFLFILGIKIEARPVTVGMRYWIFLFLIPMINGSIIALLVYEGLKRAYRFFMKGLVS